ncbi:serine/threonine-protein phosphatase 6 regulatory ankyrin repeat subunit B isoform X1 [Drosophila elegans]|uniref:serine/threonine-protein phosphatase 6 regulatory ankyrin repeat subunit B isoform X1 n=1 Tax=Drosophila elegans TaxID=30023 RepID=UPI0007E651E8|nr:serine/threonine-protein phosphatase 6 regulatory ankyrin repeat subunit B isoform X1 [Drosophila elegans]
MTESESGQSDEELVYKLGQEDPELLPWPNFESGISDPTVNSVRLEWSLLKNALVYSVEKFNKRLGWMQVHWTTSSPVDVSNLEENFGYRLRVKALRVSEDGRRYVPLAISPDIIACTTAALPSTSCLNRAIRKGQQFLVKRMLRRRPSLVEYPAPNGFLPLANAIIQGEMCIIDVLLSAGCSVHLGNPGSGRTPLHLAFYHGHLPSARILLNKKAHLEATDGNGMTPAHCAVDANQLEMVKFALESGANVEARDICGWTLLMRADSSAAVVMNASLELIKVLVTHGADLAALDGVGKSCTDLAKLYRRQEAEDYFDKVQKFRLQKSVATADAVTKAQLQQ